MTIYGDGNCCECGEVLKFEPDGWTHICPKCGKKYKEHPALSRTDNETLICSDCGTREALESIGIKPEEQDEILNTIHRSMEQ